MGNLPTRRHLIMSDRGRCRYQRSARSVKPCSVELPAPANLLKRSDRHSRIAGPTFSSTCLMVKMILTPSTVQTLRRSFPIRTATSYCRCQALTRRRSVHIVLRYPRTRRPKVFQNIAGKWVSQIKLEHTLILLESLLQSISNEDSIALSGRLDKHG